MVRALAVKVKRRRALRRTDRRAVPMDIPHLPARVVVPTDHLRPANAPHVFEELSGVPSWRLMITRMTNPARPQQCYDHRLRISSLRVGRQRDSDFRYASTWATPSSDSSRAEIGDISPAPSR